ncbi:MAG: hypothetical protein NVS1B14_12930 [Vulcanimicrobiaceae bacterium]
MRSHLLCSLFAVLLAGGPLTAAVPASAATRLAPADEYFGHLKMSILGIRNQLRDLEMKAAWRGESKRALLGKASLIEDAMAEWSRKYPGDPWIHQFRRRLTVCYVRIAALR